MPAMMQTAGYLPAGALLALLALAGADAAQAREITCRIEQSGASVLDGPCRFQPDGGGSFILSALERERPLFRGVSLVTVTVVATGIAEVRGLTETGVNSRWGEARRSRRDRACWEGVDFRICAY